MSEVGETIQKVARQTVIGRKNMSRADEWISHKPEKFQGFLTSFDDLVTVLNRQLANVGAIPDDLVNIQTLASLLKGKKLPKISELVEEVGRGDRKAFFSFARGMFTMNEMMKRGESGGEEPKLSFHTRDIDEESLVVGALFHGYEELVKRDPEIVNVVELDQIGNGLIEVLGSDRESPLFAPVADKGKLDWIDGYEGFSPEFRHKLGFK